MPSAVRFPSHRANDGTRDCSGGGGREDRGAQSGTSPNLVEYRPLKTAHFVHFGPSPAFSSRDPGIISMNNEGIWNDESRDQLGKTFQRVILGELRLAKRGHEEILEACREAYIPDDCPDRERDTFIQFATDELNRTATGLTSEMAMWPEETDCDRLDRVEVALRERGIRLWQASPCCDTCTGGELPDRIALMNLRYPGFRDRVRGYAFFIDQNMPEQLAESPRLSVYSGYGWFSPEFTRGTRSASPVRSVNV